MKQILEGMRNNFFPPKTLKEQIENVHSYRMNICNYCPHHSKNHKTIRPDDHCVICGCTLATKTRCLSCNCPKEYWFSENPISHEKENDI